MSKSKVELLYGWFVEPCMDYKRIRLTYIKNNKEQNAIFMNYNKDGGKDYRLVEDNHYPHNRLREKEQQEISYILNNNMFSRHIYGQC